MSLPITNKDAIKMAISSGISIIVVVLELVRLRLLMP